jgi:hypothetical protein
MVLLNVTQGNSLNARAGDRSFCLADREAAGQRRRLREIVRSPNCARLTD